MMRTKRMALAGALMVALGGVAVAQTAAPGSAEGNMNNPGSVKSNAEKGGRDAAPAAGVAPGTAPAATGTVTGGGSRTVPKPSDPTPSR
ncbi:hypothetical protein [Methylobacterium sp. WSM2598]|uniref:hypothetical protein n=1 Tax=Methylobacterium sp. WSM2598 TaxID=398261 RepID=UPI00037BE108